MTETLKLMAQTADDLTVLSSLLQDAAVRVGDIAWLPLERRFALVGNRFRWEKKRRFFRPKGERVRTGLTLTGVLSAETNGLNLQNKEEVLDLLSVTAEETGDEFVILFAFAGGATIRLTAECIEASLSDLGEAWEALSRPEHD